MDSIRDYFLRILEGMRTVGPSSEFPIVRVVKVATDDFKLFVNGSYYPNRDTLDEYNNGGHFNAEQLADLLENPLEIFTPFEWPEIVEEASDEEE